MAVECVGVLIKHKINWSSMLNLPQIMLAFYCKQGAPYQAEGVLSMFATQIKSKARSSPDRSHSNTHQWWWAMAARHSNS
ncbi:hypothetical protein O9929_06595 [Vibrio lentus]|nr:hypothetical protein [Vibrio lentus]